MGTAVELKYTNENGHGRTVVLMITDKSISKTQIDIAWYAMGASAPNLFGTDGSPTSGKATGILRFTSNTDGVVRSGGRTVGSIKRTKATDKSGTGQIIGSLEGGTIDFTWRLI
ncbi:MAG: hypothetical protein ACKOUT_01880 [Novosphingobium sp.]